MASEYMKNLRRNYTANMSVLFSFSTIDDVVVAYIANARTYSVQE